jgi:hypothetical protein
MHAHAHSVESLMDLGTKGTCDGCISESGFPLGYQVAVVGLCEEWG